MVIDILLRCVEVDETGTILPVEWPDIFSLVWGVDPKILNTFPKEYRVVVSDILREMAKEEESNDYIDKKLHRIIIELLYVEYKKQVNDYVKAEILKMNVVNRQGGG